MTDENFELQSETPQDDAVVGVALKVSIGFVLLCAVVGGAWLFLNGEEEAEAPPPVRHGRGGRLQGIWILPDRLSKRVVQEGRGKGKEGSG